MGESESVLPRALCVVRRYTSSQLVEVNAHSLFSKWFSESGKLVSKLFAAITELVEEPQSLVFVLIDEVESLTAARKVSTGPHHRMPV
jgi:SpoVK/Ycf46/Vps4 family AAA+-type ATPase